MEEEAPRLEKWPNQNVHGEMLYMENLLLAPEGFTGNEDVWEINTEFNLWTLHAWIELENPEGIFKPRNPMLP